jgi:hypothetical protein
MWFDDGFHRRSNGRFAPQAAVLEQLHHRSGLGLRLADDGTDLRLIFTKVRISSLPLRFQVLGMDAPRVHGLLTLEFDMRQIFPILGYEHIVRNIPGHAGGEFVHSPGRLEKIRFLRRLQRET